MSKDIIRKDVDILAGGFLMFFLEDIRERICTSLEFSLIQVLDELGLEEKINFSDKLVLEEPRSKDHGDYACNIALMLSKELKMSPRDVATKILEKYPHDERTEGLVEKLEVAGPGFINIFLKTSWLSKILLEIEDQGDNFGRLNIGEGQKVQIEFVSANPTGPLHAGHARGAVVGDTMANVLSFSGYEVEREFYINNAGRQMELLGLSIYLRFQELQGEKVEFPEDGYRGDYIKELAQQIEENYGEAFNVHPEKERIALCREFGYQALLMKLKEDLQAFGIKFDNWFSERSLHDENLIEESLANLKKKRLLYEEEGASWFASSHFGDEKDRVVIRSNKEYTYFAADIAYHFNKLERGFTKLINVWGADHHGHIMRMKAAIEAFGYNPDVLQIIIVQLVNLMRGSEKIQMSKRAGEFVTMKEVVEEVGKDAVRYFNLVRNPDSHMDFDLELAKEQSTTNPVYYLQYAHARSSSLLKKAKEEGIELKKLRNLDLTVLSEELEKELMWNLARFPQVIEESCVNLSPHYLATYGQELAQTFHVFYNKCPIIGSEKKIQDARLALVWANQRVLKNLFGIMGINAPETM